MSIDSPAPPSNLKVGADSLSRQRELDALTSSNEFGRKSNDWRDSADLGVSLSDDSPTTVSPLPGDSESRSSTSHHQGDDSTSKLVHVAANENVHHVSFQGMTTLNVLSREGETILSDVEGIKSQHQASGELNGIMPQSVRVQPTTGPAMEPKAADVALETISLKASDVTVKTNPLMETDATPRSCPLKDAHVAPKASRAQDANIASKSTPLINTDVKTGHESEFEYLSVPEAMRRCISLRIATPGGSKSTGSAPKKVVRFADALGLDLTSVRQIMNADEPPLVPLSALRYLKFDAGFSSSESVTSAQLVTALCFCFGSPGSSPDFTRRVQTRKVLLESVSADDDARAIHGVVCVANIAFEKRVVVRWTLNGWMTHSDVEARYAGGSGDAAVDRFAFKIHLPEYFCEGSRMEFSIMYAAANETYWDSNNGVNYRVECYAKSVARDERFAKKLDDNPFY